MLVALVVAASIALSPGTQSTTSITTDALGMDAQSYASDYGVTVEEARRRLNLQESVGELEKHLVDNESATFAGLWIQHEPEYRIVTRFTQDGEATVRPHVTGGSLDGIVDVRTADATLDGLKAAQNSAMTTADGVGVPVESEIDVIGNRVKLFVVDRAELESALSESGVQLPNKVDIITVVGLSRTTTDDLFAGFELDSPSEPDLPCTSGFAVTHSDGREGITTAGHCPNDETYDTKALPFVVGYVGGSHDVQWHEAPDFTLRGLMKDGTNNRYVHGTKHRSQQSVGAYVCKYGRATSYGCGNIVAKDLRPAADSACQGSCSYSPTFIRVRNSGGADLANIGDSGGPWFSGNTAYGIMRGEATADGGNTYKDGVYMAVNYVSKLGVTVMTEE